MNTAHRSMRNQRMRRALRTPTRAITSAALRPTAALRVFPDYIIAGAQRSGATSLQRVLSEHPNLTSANHMEGVHYFDIAFHHSAGWYRIHFPTKAYARWVTYRTDAPLRVGEASPYYMFHPLAPQRIRETLPGVKIIVILRDPVERTISHHKHEMQRGNEQLDLESALSAESARLEGEELRIRTEGRYTSAAHRNFSYIARSMYDWQIARLLTLFGRDQVLVLESDSFFSNPRPVYERVLEFLEVPIWLPHEFPRVNATSTEAVAPTTRRRLAQAFRTSNARVFEMVQEEFPWQ